MFFHEGFLVLRRIFWPGVSRYTLLLTTERLSFSAMEIFRSSWGGGKFPKCLELIKSGKTKKDTF